MSEDKHTGLGLERVIDRRDFIGGVAASAAGAALFASSELSVAASASPLPAAGEAAVGAGAVSSSEYYPPSKTGLRGQYPGSFEVAHTARDGGFAGTLNAEDTGERYDLVVVGGGISGLSAAYFFRKALGDNRRILVLDNHDDFGGHAKRNEFTHDGRTYVGYGGTMSIEGPFPHSYLSKALIAELGVDVSTYRSLEHREVYKGLGRAVFFDREHFGSDRLVTGNGDRPWEQFFADAPLNPDVRADLTRVHTAKVDYLAGLSPKEKVETLKKISYQDYLLKHANLSPASVPFFAGVSFRNNMRFDTCPAYTAAFNGGVGFSGLNLPPDPQFRADYFHFPDGNASIARLLVSRLVPGVYPGKQTQNTIVTATTRYDRLDTNASSTRIRLNSTVVRVEHIGKPTSPDGVRVVYSREGKHYQVTGDNVVMACFNSIIPHIVPALPEDQKKALAYASKVPMQYTNVFLRNWEPWKKLGVNWISAPNGYHTSASLDLPISIGDYKCPTDPSKPIVVHMIRNPNQPGLPRKDQHRVGRADMLATPFSTIEKEIRSQLNRMLGSAGFDAQRDILAITANRWPHGYAYTYDSVGDPDMPEAERPHVLGRRAFGRITIANADAGAAAYTNTAIDEAHRAVEECMASRGLV